jgi:hypothetical protein
VEAGGGSLPSHTISIDLDWTWGYIKLARSPALEKKCNEAFAQAEIAERRIAGGVGALSRAWLGSTYAACGDVSRARQKLAELQAFQAKRYVDPATFADIYASLGEIDEAVVWFRKAYDDRSPDMVYAQVSSRLNPRLAANTDFRAVMAKMAFPPSAK